MLGKDHFRSGRTEARDCAIKIRGVLVGVHNVDFPPAVQAPQLPDEIVIHPGLPVENLDRNAFPGQVFPEFPEVVEAADECPEPSIVEVPRQVANNPFRPPDYQAVHQLQDMERSVLIPFQFLFLISLAGFPATIE
jgi:hypothetical protein